MSIIHYLGSVVNVFWYKINISKVIEVNLNFSLENFLDEFLDLDSQVSLPAENETLRSHLRVQLQLLRTEGNFLESLSKERNLGGRNKNFLIFLVLLSHIYLFHRVGAHPHCYFLFDNRYTGDALQFPRRVQFTNKRRGQYVLTIEKKFRKSQKISKSQVGENYCFLSDWPLSWLDNNPRSGFFWGCSLPPLRKNSGWFLLENHQRVGGTSSCRLELHWVSSFHRGKHSDQRLKHIFIKL